MRRLLPALGAALALILSSPFVGEFRNWVVEQGHRRAPPVVDASRAREGRLYARPTAWALWSVALGLAALLLWGSGRGDAGCGASQK